MMTTEASERSWFVYVLRNPDGKIYIGQTDHVPHRLYQHNDPIHTLTRTTKRLRGPWELVYSEAATSRSAALSREKALKSGQGRAWFKRHLGC
jgi:putative endonuclease